jgi:thiol-disulfide isomerase/thioredoxin
MSKATRIRQQNARERIAAQRAAARKQEIRNRFLITGGSVLVVVIVVVAFIVFKVSQNSSGSGGSNGTALPASVINDVTKVPASTLNAVGAGQVYPKSITSISAPKLTSGGKPEMLYIGAEYCPYCATERWAMAVALSRFGTFTGLRGIHSISTDVDPNTPTLTFYKSTYTSKYLVFMPVEETTVSKAALQTPTAAQQALLAKYDSPPYVSSTEQGAIPFIDFAGQYLVHGAQYNPQDLQGKTWAEVASALNDQSSTIGKGADGAANTITAAICKITKDKPASVCGSSMIKSLQGQL